MPYGDRDNDWLGIDRIRGNESAGYLLSNDQTVGFIDITQSGNPKLRDKTNREGLIEEGNAWQDFVFVNQLFLRYFRAHTYAQYLETKKQKKERSRLEKGKPIDIINSYRKKASEEEIDMLNKIEESYRIDRKVLEEQRDRTINLAAVGLSFQTGTHDIRIRLYQLNSMVSRYIADIKKVKGEITL